MGIDTGQKIILESAAETPELPYVPNPYVYRRRPTRVVMVGKVGVGGDNPIRIQSMTTTRTQDIEATVAQIVRLVQAGCEIVRVTTPTSADARALGQIKHRLLQMGIDVPLVADIHFSPAAAMEAALYADKVRINPGNFADEKRFVVREYSDEEYQAALERIEEKFKPLVLRCKERGISMRIGTNHGSLSDRIMNRFGDTPEGMVESALEFAAICRKYDYHDIIFSMKASNPKVMIEAYRLLVARLDALGWNYPLHLGVTEAGNAEDGRIKSAVGIGSLLDDGLGDTVRVSLTEEPEEEIPVARALVQPYNDLLKMERLHPQNHGREVIEIEQPKPKPKHADGASAEALPDLRDPYHYVPRPTYEVPTGQVKVGGLQPVAVVASVGERDEWPDGDLLKAVAELARRRGPNALRPDLICVPMSGLPDLGLLVEELKRRSEEEDPTAGKSALGLLVDAGSDYEGAARAAPQLASAGGLKLSASVQTSPNWEAYERCVKAALEARVPLWLQAMELRPALENAIEVMHGGTARGFPVVDLVMEMASRAHALGHRGLVLSLYAHDSTPSYLIRAYRLLATRLIQARRKYPIHIVDLAEDRADEYAEEEQPRHTDHWLIGPSIGIGSLLCDGIGNSVEVDGDGTAEERVALAFNILQAAGSRVVKAEFVACPSCGRTLFDLQETTERIKRATGHLRGVKIAVMGCIVNGLGELADADFGYMGGAPGRVNLFVGKECVEKGVPTEQAVDRLIDIIKAHGKWIEPPAAKA
jgi:(E)-4-hydroxy-3-methylbut-2-enyl-diphosphate synthase